MGWAPLLAGAAAVAGAGAVWSLLGALDQGLAGLLAAAGPDGPLTRVLAPLRGARDPSRRDRARLGLTGGAALLVGGWLVGGPLLALVLAAAAPLAARQALAIARRRRQARLAEAAPAVARALADALTGGQAIRSALGQAARSVPGGAGAELQAAASALALGEPTETVLERLREQAGHPAWDAIAAAILLQREAGGDLATLLRDLAAALEEQVRAEADARGLTAQARFTALLVGLLPLGAASITELGRPGYVASLLGRPLPGMLLATAAVLQVTAWLAIRRAARLRG